MTSSGAILFAKPPASAPASVSGSISTSRSQSTSARSARGWRFRAFMATFAMAPPSTVMFESGIANFGLKPITST